MNEKFIKYVKIVDTDKKSWRIRYALVEAWVTVLDSIEKETIKKDVVESFEELLKDPEHEVRSIAVLKLPELARRLTPGQSTTVFMPVYEKLAKDTSQHVRQAVVESILSFLNTIEKDKLLTAGVSIIELLLKDEAVSVRIGLI
jgi:HEAT repeat protein